MGHIHLGVLPQTKKWREVVALLTSDATPADVVAASALAAEKDLLAAARDPVFTETVRLLALIPVAGRSDDFALMLRDNDVPASNAPDIFALAAAIGMRLDSVARKTECPSDFRELARRALLSTVTSHLGDRLPGLLPTTPDDVHRAARHLSAPNEFSGFARGFFTRLVGETLRYWLDRELANHMGPRARFADTRSRGEFDRAVMQFSMESTRIIKEFAAGWFAKNAYGDGAVTGQTAAAFGAIALRKTLEELRRKQATDA